MTQFLLLALEDEAAHAALSPKAMADLIDARARYTEQLREQGKLVDSARLRPSKEGKRLARQGERLVISEGPFVEADRSLNGYYWLEASNLEDALQMAKPYPRLATDEVDVRPLMKGAAPHSKESKPGKVFACAVLGNASTETAWVEVMDRIDAETQGKFSIDEVLGGARLREPSSGKRVVTRSGQVAVLDGPFLESKEVIGGVFLLRMNVLGDAVRWATATRFIAHGALEIRELWRT
jgi:hypothetical protein